MALKIPTHKFKFALAKQSAEGTPATVAEYAIPAYAGDAGPEEARANHDVVDGNAWRPGEYKQRLWASGAFEFAAFPDSLPRIISAHAGAANDTVTGGADPYTHTQVRKDSPQYHTVWVARPKTDGTFEWDKLVDCLFKSIEFRYASGQLLHVAVELLGMSAVGNATGPTITTTNQITAADHGFTSIGATMLLDLATTPAATAYRKLESATVRLDYTGMALNWTDSLTPRYFEQGRWEVSFTATGVAEDWTEFNQTFYGSAAPSANTAGSALTTRGALDFTFPIAPTANANRTFQIIVPEIQFSVTRPAADPGGGGLRYAMRGILQSPASGEPVTLKTKNAVATAYGS